MKKVILLSFLLICSFASAQTYKSSRITTQDIKFQTKDFNRTIIINNESVVISKYLNAGKEDFELRVDKIVEKNYNEVMCKWYYCTTAKKDAMLGFTKAIVVVPLSGKSIYLFDFADEVNIFYNEFSIN